jgi:GT2 family glycosyltransferase
MALHRMFDSPRVGRQRREERQITLADSARDARRWELAARLYQKALDRNPRNSPIWVQYGHALKESGELRDPDKLAQAEAAYRRALSIDPSVADTHLQLGHIQKLQGKTEEAKAAYLRALALDVSMPYPLEELRGLGWARGELSELLGMLGKTLSLEDHKPLPDQSSSGYFDAEWYVEHYKDVAAAGIDPLEHFLTYGLKEGRKPHAEALSAGACTAVTDAEICCFKQPLFSDCDEVAIYVTHSPNNRLKPHVPHYVDSLKRQSIAVILIVNTDGPLKAMNLDLVGGADGIFVRANKGYDFAAWAHILRLHPLLFDSKILYLLNESLLGPTNNSMFGALLTRLRNSPADFIGLTQNFDRTWHIQSYFLAVKHLALSSAAFRKFIDAIVSYDDIEDVINAYELRLAPLLKDADLNCEVLFPTTDLRDPTIYHWKYLLQSGFPFIKIKTVRDVFAGVDISDWRELLANQGYDVSLAERTIAEFSKSSIAAARQLDPKIQIREQASSELSAFFASHERLTLPYSEHPLVSILMVLFNEAELTFRCLCAVIDTVDEPAEVIIVDNASSDNTALLLGRVDGARIIRNKENLHFLRAVNQGSAIARGAALLLLNNDTKMMPGGLRAAVETLYSAADIGAVGGKLVLPDESLQEAGSIIWSDGTCAGYGRGQDPHAPEYQFRRDVDYCSAAFLLIRRALFENLGRLDDVFAPAYYEETDFCMRLRYAGHRIVYDPRVEVLHYEFGSSREQASTQMRQNHTLFYERHWRVLAKHHLPPASSVLNARMSDRRRPRVLVIEDLVPFPSHGAGFPRSFRFLKALHAAGCFITYYPVSQPDVGWKEVYATFPIETEFMLGRDRDTLEGLLDARAGYYNAIVVCRPNNMELFVKHFELHPGQYCGVSIIYDAEALFNEREAMRLVLAGTPMTEEERERQLRDEIDLARAADAVVAVSIKDAGAFKAAGHSNVHVVGHAIEPQPTETDFAVRQDFLFVGRLEGDWTPNTDSIFWFVEEVMPCLDRLLHDTPYKLYVAGLSSAPRLRDLINPRVVLLGRVADLTAHYRAARVFVAPTRFSAGIPHKIHETAARGLPAVVTSLLARQLGWNSGTELLIGDTPEDFAAQCARLYTDRTLWYSLREAALAKVTEDCNPLSFNNKVAAMLRSIGCRTGALDSIAEGIPS